MRATGEMAIKGKATCECRKLVALVLDALQAGRLGPLGATPY